MNTNRCTNFFQSTLLISFLAILLFPLIGTVDSYAQEKQSVTYPYLPATHPISNTATVGQVTTLTIFGYATKYALVFLESNSNLGTTVAKEDGEFRFSNISVPKDTREICLSYTDRFGNNSATTCIPFSESYYGYSIGPVVLSPTITLVESIKDLGEEIIVRGASIPNQPVRLYSFSDKIATFTSFLSPRKVYAIPPIETVADESGQYEYAIKTEDAQEIRLYTASSLDDLSSDKSTALKAEILPFWVIYLRKLLVLLDTFLGNMKNILLLIELMILYVIICYYLLPQKEKSLLLRNTSLLIRKTGLLVREPSQLIKKGANSLVGHDKA